MLCQGHSYSEKINGYNQSQGGFTSSQTTSEKKKAAFKILPCTVSQLLSAWEANDVFMIGDTEINQVSLVGVITRIVPFVANILYSVDDMSGPPMDVKYWTDTEDPHVLKTTFSPGTYVKVSATLHTFQGQRSLVALNMRRLDDLNEITSHMLEVVQAHMQLGGVANGDGNSVHGGGPSTAHTETNGLTTTQNHVLNVVKSFSAHEGIRFQDLLRRCGCFTVSNIRLSLKFLLNEGYIFSTIDEEHFKATDNSG